jgi:hypothetical protein
MTEETRCAFCEHSWPASKLRREYELDFCDTCAVDTEGVIAARRGHGDAISVREWTTEVHTGKRTQTFYHVSVHGTPGARIPATATFTREGMWEKLKKLFNKEVQIGDPLFDDFIYIGTGDRAATHALLQDSGVQSVLMDLVGNHERVSFAHGAVEVYHQSTEPVYAAGALLPVCALFVHSERLHAAQR